MERQLDGGLLEKTAVAMKPKPTPLGVGCYHQLKLLLPMITRLEGGKWKKFPTPTVSRATSFCRSELPTEFNLTEKPDSSIIRIRINLFYE